MRKDSYVKIVLTIIALALLANLWQSRENLVKTAEGRPPENSPGLGVNHTDLLDRLDAIEASLMERLDSVEAQNQEILASLGTATNNVDTVFDLLENRLPCPLDEFLDGTCQSNPASTTVTFCISQGRGGSLGAIYKVEPKVNVDAGVRWDVAALGDVSGSVDFPFTLVSSFPLPVPTELNIGGSAGLGRNLNICIDVPIKPADIDMVRLDNLVKDMHAPPALPGFDRNKFQRRLQRILGYAEVRTPGRQTNSVTASAAVEEKGAADEFDLMDDAIERFMSGDFQIPDGPFGIFKSPMIHDLRTSLAIPAPLQQVLDDPDGLLGLLPNVLQDGGLNVQNVDDVCGKFGLSGPIAQRFQTVAGLCNLLNGLPSFQVTSTAFDTIHTINGLFEDLPDEIIFGVGDIIPDPVKDKLPTPRPSGSKICNVFPRLCR